MATIERHVTRDLVSLDAHVSCRESARAMFERRIGSIAVRQNGSVVGLVTERDLVARVLASGASSQLPIGEAMRRGLPTVACTATDVECAELMRANFSRHLLVAQDGHTIGVVSMRDVIALMLEEKEFLIDQLQTYINGR